MKSKTLTALVLAGALAVGGTKAFAQQVITEPDPTGIVQEYYYTDGRLSGYKDTDGSVFSLGASTNPSPTGYYVTSVKQDIESALYAISTAFTAYPKDMPASVIKTDFGMLEKTVTDILGLPEMQRDYVKKGDSDVEYYNSRVSLFRAIQYFYKLQNYAPTEGSVMSIRNSEALLNNPLFLNKDVFDHDTQAVFKTYEAIAGMYYTLGRNETDPIKKKEHFAKGVEHGYHDLTRKFGEDYVLGKMNKDQSDYLGYVRSCFRYSDQTISANIIDTARKITL